MVEALRLASGDGGEKQMRDIGSWPPNIPALLALVRYALAQDYFYKHVKYCWACGRKIGRTKVCRDKACASHGEQVCF